MAKISARGATKVAQANRQWTDEDGWTHKIRLALRSDGKVLRAHDLKSPDSGYWNRGGYSITGTLSAKDGRTPLARFERYVTQRGFTLK
jgi:hypothetical protein